MKLSAIMFALILTATQATAYADGLVVAEGDESASNQTISTHEGEVYGPSVASNDATADAVTTNREKADRAEFERLLGGQGSSQVGDSAADRKAVGSVSAAAWPWWSVPLGLLAIGALLIVRGKALNKELPQEAIQVVSRQPMGKDGSLALIEVQDGDSRKRRLLVGLGGGSPRLVADISAWEVAVAAPSNIANDALAIVGDDPMPSTPAEVKERRSQLHVAPASFETQLSQAAALYGANDAAPEATEQTSQSKADLIEDVLAKRDLVRLETVGNEPSARSGRGGRKPSYSSREILV